MRPNREVIETMDGVGQVQEQAIDGTLIADRYRLESRIGSGGMGQVWKAHHIGLDRAVAIKFVEARGPELRERLLREARVLASLRHPAIVEVFDCGDDASLGPYIAMELFDGVSLAERLESGPLKAIAAIRLFLPLLEGLGCAHQKGIVHRDVKPANVLVRGEQAKLIDFGIAYVVRAGQTRLTHAGGIIGTPAYMAPEQIRSEPVDARADIWGVAVTLLESIAGRPVFDGPDPVAVMAAVLRGLAARPKDVPGLDDDLWRIFERALGRSPSDRFSTAADFGQALSVWLSARGPTAPAERAAPASAPAAGPSLDSLIRKTFWDS